MDESSYQQLEKTRVSFPNLPEQEIQHLAESYGTPLYVLDEGSIRSRLAELEAAYGGFKGPLSIAYSVKANFNPTLLKVLISEGILFDISSLGELFFYIMAGGPPENTIYTSILEGRGEYKEALVRGVSRIVVSSYHGLLNLIEAARSADVKPSVLIRVNPEVGVKAEVRASYRHGKFGVPFNTNTADSAASLLRKTLSTQDVVFDGFHFHLGSQIINPVCFVNALEKLDNFIQKVRREFPSLTANVIDIGGGTPAFYGTPVPSPKEMGALITAKLNLMVEALQDRFTLIVESGRFLTAEACIMISRIANKKAFEGQKFVFIDAGYHLLLDAALLNQDYPQRVVPRSVVKEPLKVHLVGPLCDTCDILPISPASDLAGADVGKLVVFHNVGAYSLVFNMPFHCQTKPAVVMRRINGEYALVRRGETLEELFSEEGGNLELAL